MDCVICHREITRFNKDRGQRVSRGNPKTCNLKCSIALAIKENRFNRPAKGTRMGAENPAWKGGVKRIQGYKMVIANDHPNAVKSGSGRCGYVMEHRLVMEKMIGRYLRKDEAVHHINAIRDDNRPENLRLVVRKVHKGQVTCPFCQKTFVIN